jgi:hypothetical protein
MNDLSNHSRLLTTEIIVNSLEHYRPRINLYDKYDRCDRCDKWIPKSSRIRCPVCNWRMHKVNRRNKSPEARRKNIIKQRLIRKFGTCVGYTEVDLNIGS